MDAGGAEGCLGGILGGDGAAGGAAEAWLATGANTGAGRRTGFGGSLAHGRLGRFCRQADYQASSSQTAPRDTAQSRPASTDPLPRSQCRKAFQALSLALSTGSTVTYCNLPATRAAASGTPYLPSSIT